ncbi:uncharacterized protein [Nicotiana tomentosiformis]|uniref:uncharacterized protein n=1 Tax=Nicotiana tomentosiformis TaxID=4098 RepID=UPI00388C5AE5
MEEILSWPKQSFATEIQSFLGLAYYYRHFVESFSSIAASLTRLTHKGAPFRWSNECEESFQKLKTALITTAVLVLPSALGSYTVYCDVSRIGIRCSELEATEVLRAVKDYDTTILYHHKKANMVDDALSRKPESMGSLAYIPVGERPLALDVQALSNQFKRLDVSEPSRVLACMVSRSSLYELIKARQYDDPYLLVLKDTVQHDDAKEVKYKHQRQGCLLQRLDIPEWKWEHITMDFGVGLLRTLKKFDAVWVILDRLTHFILVLTTYSSE